VSGDESMEKIITDYSHLIRRSFWKVCGQSFLLNNYVISIGKMEQGNISNSLILEISYVGEDLMSNALIYESIYTVAKSLFPSIVDNSDIVSSFLNHTTPSSSRTRGTEVEEEEKKGDWDEPTKNFNDNVAEQSFTIADRCLQWMSFLKQNA
jgi:hypothetical protein